MIYKYRNILFYAAMIAASISLSGCATEPSRLPDENPLSWPAPPQEAKIRYVREIRTDQDLGATKSLGRRFREFINGTESLSISQPYGIATSSDDELFVVDNQYQRILVFDMETGDSRSFPDELHNFLNPVNIVVADDRKVFVSDSAAGLVHVWEDYGRKFLRSFGENILTRPTGIAHNPDSGEILVLDTKKSLLFLFDDTTFELRDIIGNAGDGDYRVASFHFPTNLVLDAQRNIYVTDALNFRVQILNRRMQPLQSFGKPGNAPGHFSRPKGIALDSDGNIYVVDSIFDNVQIFSPTGELLMAFGGPGQKRGQFWLPNAIHIDEKDRIYVSDSYNHRIQVFQYLPNSEDNR